MGWITKAVWQDRSYKWAKVYLGMHHNRKSGMAPYNVNEEYISDAELFDLLKAEENKEPTPQRFISSDSQDSNGNHPCDSETKDYSELLDAL